MTTAKTEAIRALNDQLRANLRVGGGGALITTGVAALGHEVVARIFKTIAVYDEFCNANDLPPPVRYSGLGYSTFLLVF
jgi:hypothetical protein